MILHDHEGKLYNAHFHHEIGPDQPRSFWVPRKIRGIRETSCTIHEGACVEKKRPCGTPGAFNGVAKCAQMDQFCRYTGRKLAFGRAVANYPRAIRQSLWRDFLTQSGVVIFFPVEGGDGRPTQSA